MSWFVPETCLDTLTCGLPPVFPAPNPKVESRNPGISRDRCSWFIRSKRNQCLSPRPNRRLLIQIPVKLNHCIFYYLLKRQEQEESTYVKWSSISQMRQKIGVLDLLQSLQAPSDGTWKGNPNGLNSGSYASFSRSPSCTWPYNLHACLSLCTMW